MALSGPGGAPTPDPGPTNASNRASTVDSPEFSAALREPAHPSAKSGYGKRSAPGQFPRGKADFAHLRPREAAIAAYIDRLPEGAAIGYKPLAANIADYGQQACAKVLKFLSYEGHLRLVKEHLCVADDSFRWVTRTYFSRTSRDDDWWRAYVDGLAGIDLTELERGRRGGATPVEDAGEDAAVALAAPDPEAAGAPEEPVRAPAPAPWSPPRPLRCLLRPSWCPRRRPLPPRSRHPPPPTAPWPGSGAPTPV